MWLKIIKDSFLKLVWLFENHQNYFISYEKYKMFYEGRIFNKTVILKGENLNDLY